VVRFKPAERRRLVDALQDFAASAQLPPEVVHAADLSLEEHITNVIDYGYTDPDKHEIIVRLQTLGNELVVEVEDDGVPFNPLDHPEVDTSLDMEEKPIGGLGIHLIRRFMDDLSYRYEGRKNILTLRKRLTESAG
jgi:anti-sigma regulatory factor (Ser/Thr protein kinase)